MANDIYTTTLGGLSELVSPRVAEGVLNRALRAVDRTPDDVDARAMSRLLRGRVRRELERSLPTGGLRRSLARIERRMLAVDDRPWKAKKPDVRTADPHADLAPARPAARVVDWRHEPADDGDPAQRMRAFPIAADLPDAAPDTPYDPWPAEAARDATATASDAPIASGTSAPIGAGASPAPAPSPAPAARAEPAPAPRPEQAPAPRPASASAASPAVATPRVATRPPAPAAPRAPRALPESAIDRIAALSGVRQWVWTSEGAVQGQGEGPEPATVAGDVRATIALLSRHGRVTSLHVHHDAGHVLVGVSDRATLVVSGDEGVNLGAVYTTFRALEEAP